MPSAEPSLSLWHAAALGALHGPAELLPVSSSAHTQLLPWLAGWPYASSGGEERKTFEVALHIGAAAALAISLRGELAEDLRAPTSRGAGALALALLPPAVAGVAMRETVERRLGGPRCTAAGLAAGALAMALADRERAGGREPGDAGAVDGLALGLAQAVALVPGVSRSGATLAAARLRGFSRDGAWRLSWLVGLPVIAGAGALKATRPGSLGQPRTPLIAGAVSAFASTLAAATVMRRPAQRAPLLLFSLYRLLLAGAILRRARRER